MYHIPEVSVSVNGKEQIMSVLSRDLMSKRTIYLNGEINDEAALSIITQLHYLEDNSQEPITLVINSPGGSVSAGLAIYDVMQALSCPVTTAAVGLAASMAALVLAAGTKGRRYASPNSRVMRSISRWAWRRGRPPTFRSPQKISSAPSTSWPSASPPIPATRSRTSSRIVSVTAGWTAARLCVTV